MIFVKHPLRKIKLFSDSLPQRDFIHISDICNVVELLTKSKDSRIVGVGILNNTFYIAPGDTLTILESAHIIKKVLKERYQK